MAVQVITHKKIKKFDTESPNFKPPVQKVEEETMAVEQITFKKITKFDTESPNFKPPPQPEPEEVNGNLLVEEDEDMYVFFHHTNLHLL